MSRRLTLVALWALFAVASVTVGFAASGLVSDPFTDLNSATGPAAAPGPGQFTVPAGDPSSEQTPSSSGGGSPTASAGSTGRGSGSTASPGSTSTTRPSSGSGQPSTNRSTPGSGGSTQGSGQGSSSAGVKRGISTQGGYVSATCQDGLVSMGAAPAVYWQVDSITSGRATSGRVRLEPVEDAHGERVEVTATCAGGVPAFSSDYSEPGGGGSDDGSGRGSGGGYDGSSGSGGG